MICEMCGHDTDLIVARIEGVELNVCQKCAAFGMILKRARPLTTIQKKSLLKMQERQAKPAEKEVIMAVRDDFSTIIRGRREKLGLKQKELAKFLAEKESLVHKIESGEYTPSLDLARKLEKQLGISLVEQKEVLDQKTDLHVEGFTIGDVIKLK